MLRARNNLLHVEAVWGGWWREVRAVLGEAAGLVRRKPWVYGGLVLLYLLARSTLRLLPLKRLQDVILYFTAWMGGLLTELWVLAIMLALWCMVAAQLRGKLLRLPADFTMRLARALPYGIACYFLLDFLAGSLGWAVVWALDPPDKVATAVWTAASYLEGVPIAWLSARFGFVMVGIGAEGHMTLRESRDLSRGKTWPLMLTFMLWWILRRAVYDVAIFLLPFKAAGMYLNWAAPTLRAVVTVCFAVAAAVWYTRLHPGDSAGKSETMRNSSDALYKRQERASAVRGDDVAATAGRSRFSGRSGRVLRCLLQPWAG